jgi:hypothetical protein
VRWRRRVRPALAYPLRAALALLLVAFGTSASARIGESVATVVVAPHGDGALTAIEVSTNPDITRRHEMTLFLNRRDADDRGRSLIVPPTEPGRYRFEVALPAGRWNLTLRYGVGLDLYYTWMRIDIDPEGGVTQRRGALFEGDLGESVPALVQPLGFAVFGLVAVVALGLVVAVLRGLKRAEAGVPTG